MNISPIQLKYYAISRLLILPRGEVSLNPPNQALELFEWSGVNIQTNVEFGWGEKPPENLRPFAQRLGLIINNETGTPAPYQVDIELIGYFELVGSVPADLSAQDLAQVNAAAMLYSAMRELIFSSTIRFPQGPMILPGVNFLDLKTAQPGSEPTK